jgi:hypothetical protein
LMKSRISAWRDVSLIMCIALAFYTVTGIIYSAWVLAMGLFATPALRPIHGWLQAPVYMVKCPRLPGHKAGAQG